jgi:hypothetical protein
VDRASLLPPSYQQDGWQCFDLALTTTNTSGGGITSVGVSGGTITFSGTTAENSVIRANTHGDVISLSASGGTATFSGTNAEKVGIKSGVSANAFGTATVAFDGTTGSALDFGTGAPVSRIIGNIVEISGGTSWGAEARSPWVIEDRKANIPVLERSQVEGVDLDWLTTDPEHAAGSDKLRSLYKGIQHRLRGADYAAVDLLFKNVDVRLLPAETLVAMLRYSFAAHQKLGRWSAFLNSVRQELRRRKLDARTMLSGLGMLSAE